VANEAVGRGSGGTGGMGGGQPGQKAGMLGQKAGDFVEGGAGTRRAMGAMGGMAMAMGGGGGRGGRGQMMTMLAQAQGRAQDPVLRQDLMKLHQMSEIGRFTSLRSKAAVAQGRRPGPEASTGKLNVSRMTRATRETGLAILGAHGMLKGGDAPMGGAIGELATFSPAVSIYGGTDEIQHNIIGERVLGLPKEPDLSRDVPFKELKVGTQKKPAE